MTENSSPSPLLVWSSVSLTVSQLTVPERLSDPHQSCWTMSTRLMRHTNKKHTITSREIWTAVHLLLPGELSKLAVSEGTKYTSSITNIHCCFFLLLFSKPAFLKATNFTKDWANYICAKWFVRWRLAIKTCVYSHLMYNNGKQQWHTCLFTTNTTSKSACVKKFILQWTYIKLQNLDIILFSIVGRSFCSSLRILRPNGSLMQVYCDTEQTHCGR